MRKGIKSEFSDVRGIINKIKKRDFSGNEGKAIKNAIFSFSTTLVAKVGSTSSIYKLIL